MIGFYLFGCFLFIFLQGFFSASEIAFISSDLLKLRHKAEKQDKRAKLAYELSSSPERFLATTLVGINLSVVISSSLVTHIFISKGVYVSNLWVTFLFTPIIVIFAELVPKNIGMYYKEELSCRVAKVLIFFEGIFYPLVRGIEKMSTLIIRKLLKRPPAIFPSLSREGIKALLKEGVKEGVLEKGEEEAIKEIFDFRATKVKDVYTPLAKIKGINYTASQEEIIKKGRKLKFTRYPVFKGREIVGYINIYDLFYNQYQDWHRCLRQIVRVGVNQKLYEVFTSLKTRRENIAVVMKGKKTVGIVTLEDIIREILRSITR